MRTRCCVTLLCAIGLALGTVADVSAHGLIGQRFFPATLTIDDPFVADELSLPTVLHIKNRGSEEGPPGLFHATAHGSCSWYEFATAIFALAGFSTPLEPTTEVAYASPVRRPFYSVLDNAALRAANLDRMRPWRVALEDYLSRRAKASTPSVPSRAS